MSPLRGSRGSKGFMREAREVPVMLLRVLGMVDKADPAVVDADVFNSFGSLGARRASYLAS